MEMEVSVEENKKKGLGIASVVLGAFSVLCCSCLGLGIVFGIIGAIFAIICILKGTGSGRTLGIVGIILSGIGILLGAYILISVALTINWANVNMEAFQKINEIDPSDEQQLQQWLQQFFLVDITGNL